MSPKPSGTNLAPEPSGQYRKTWSASFTKIQIVPRDSQRTGRLGGKPQHWVLEMTSKPEIISHPKELPESTDVLFSEILLELHSDCYILFGWIFLSENSFTVPLFIVRLRNVLYKLRWHSKFQCRNAATVSLLDSSDKIIPSFPNVENNLNLVKDAIEYFYISNWVNFMLPTKIEKETSKKKLERVLWHNLYIQILSYLHISICTVIAIFTNPPRILCCSGCKSLTFLLRNNWRVFKLVNNASSSSDRKNKV